MNGLNKIMNITITDDEIEALRICQEWGVCEGSWAYKHLSELYDRIVEEQIKIKTLMK